MLYAVANCRSQILHGLIHPTLTEKHDKEIALQHKCSVISKLKSFTLKYLSNCRMCAPVTVGFQHYLKLLLGPILTVTTV